MDYYADIVRFFQEGGVFMGLITLVLALGVAIAIERYLVLNRTRRSTEAIWSSVFPIIASAEYDEAARMISETKGRMTTLLSRGLDARRKSNDRKVVEIAIEEGLMEIIPGLEKRTPYLAAFANIATLLGLLGTIIGLTQAFDAISAADPAEKASLLSSSISLAMNTTAYGLMVAIPLLLTYTFLHTRTTEAIDALEFAAIKFINEVSELGPVETIRS